MAERKTETDTSPKDRLVRSSKEIKAGLLRDVWMTGAAAEIIARIQSRHERSEAMPEGHKEALFHIVPGQDPALMRTNLRNYLSGYPCAFSAAGSLPEAPKAGRLEPRKYQTHEIFETLLEEQKETAQKPDFLLENAPLLLAETHSDAAAEGRIYYADDVYLAHHPDAENGELNYTLHPGAAAPYLDDVYQAKENGDDPLYSEIFGAAEDSRAGEKTNAAATSLTDAGKAGAHSPYIDAFFDAARWPEQAPVAKTGLEEECEAMDRQATVKPVLSLQ